MFFFFRNYSLFHVWVFSDACARDEDVERQSIQQLEDAFDRIKEATGEDDINKIVNDFIKREDENFALYSYVSLVKIQNDFGNIAFLLHAISLQGN